MRKFAPLALLVVVGLIARIALAADAPTMQQMMEEMSKCEVCKSMLDHPNLLHEMSWETHKIDNGMLCVSAVPEKDAAEFKSLNKAMMASVEKCMGSLKKGEKVELCHFCDSMGKLMQAGAKQQEITTKNGAVSLITSDDPAVVKMIHAQADEAIAMQKQIDKMKEGAVQVQ